MTNDSIPLIYQLMIEVRVLTRSTLLHQSLVAQSLKLSVTDAECLDFLQESGTCAAGDLARLTGLTTGAVTGVINRLEKAGFVKRKADPKDKRKVLVSFIPKKHGPAKAHYQELAQKVLELFSKYNEQELELLINYTRQLGEIYQEEVGVISEKE